MLRLAICDSGNYHSDMLEAARQRVDQIRLSHPLIDKVASGVHLPRRKNPELQHFKQVDIQGKDTEIPNPQKVAYFIDGQGTYTPGLAKELMEEHGSVFDIANSATGKDVRKMAIEGTKDEIMLTENAQLITAAYVIASLEAKRKLNPNMEPEVLAGKSLGFCVAAYESGCFGPRREEESLKKFFRFLDWRSIYMQRDCEKNETRLMNVSFKGNPEKGIPPVEENKIREAMSKDGRRIQRAFKINSNFWRVGGKTDELEEAQKELQENGARTKILTDVTNGAFHTDYYRESQDLISALDLKLEDPKIPLVSNTSPVHLLKTGAEVWEEMVKIIVEEVDEQGMIEFLDGMGFEAFYKVGQQKTYDTDEFEGNPITTKDVVIKAGVAVALASAAIIIGHELRRKRNKKVN